MRPWAVDDRPLAYSAAIAVGIGIVGNSYFLLGLGFGVHRSALELLSPAAAALGLMAICLTAARSIFPGSGRLGWITAALLLPLLVVLVILSSVPPIARDELTHHLALPATYLHAGRIVEVPFADQAYYPMLLEMFYTPLLGWLPDNSPKFLHLLFGMAAAGVIGIGAARESGPRVGLFAVALTLLTPVVVALACTAYVDLGLLFFSAVALLALLRWFDTRDAAWFVLSALNAGFACTTKYNGMIVLALLAVGTVLAPGKRSAPVLGATAAAYVLLGLVPWAPWLIKNLVQTGNPIFPLFNGMLGGRPLPDRPSVDVFTRRLFLHGESWLDIAAIPLRIFLTGREGSPARFDGVLNPIFFVGIVAACLSSAKREHRLLLGFAAAYFSISFFQTDMRVRYILPILPPLVLVTAPALAALHASRRGIAIATCVAATLFSGMHLVDKWNHVAPLDYLSGRVPRSDYVARFVPELPVLEYANRHVPTRSVVYLAFLGSRSYYCRWPFTYDTYFSGITLRRYVETSSDPAELMESLRANGITHMIAADALLSRYLTDSLDPVALDRWRAFAQAHLSRLASANGVSLYEIG